MNIWDKYYQSIQANFSIEPEKEKSISTEESLIQTPITSATLVIELKRILHKPVDIESLYYEVKKLDHFGPLLSLAYLKYTWLTIVILKTNACFELNLNNIYMDKKNQEDKKNNVKITNDKKIT